VVSSCLLENKTEKLEDNALKEKIARQLNSYFRTDSQKISQWLKTKSKIAIDRIDWTTDFVGRQFKNLSQVFSIFKK